MFTRILVPLDGSARAERALPVAARIVRTSEAHLLLVRAVAVPATFGVTYDKHALKWELFRDEQEEAAKYLAEAAQSEHLAHLRVDTFVAVGQAAQVIVDAATERGADLVTMTSHGRTGLDRWVLGSVAGHVAHHSPIPVLILRAPEGTVNSQRAEMARPPRILVPLDGSQFAEAVLDPARALAFGLAGDGLASLHLTLVIPPYRARSENMPDALLLEGAKAYLERVARRLESQPEEGKLKVTWSVEVNGDIAQGILSLAEVVDGTDSPVPSSSLYTAIAMATHGHGGIARWALGSVTERVLHAAKIPILIVRPRAAATGPSDDDPR